MRAARSVLLAVLVVLASVVGSVGLVGSSAAQTSSYSQTFTTGPHKVAIDLSNVTTQTTISVITDESPAGNNTAILRKTVSGTTTSAHFRNAGAYNQFTVKVKSADAKPGFSKGGVTDAWTPGDSGKFLGDTGGDSGFTYDLSEQIGESVMSQVVQLDRTGLPGSTAVNTTTTDSSQEKLDIYQSALSSKTQAKNYRTTIDNYLSDTKTQARIIGKNAYIQALNNGSTKAVAKSQAKAAVSDYYAVKEANLLNEWNQQIANTQYLEGVQDSESGISEGYHLPKVGTASDDASHFVQNGGSGQATARINAFGSKSYTLTNGSTTTVKTVTVKLASNDGGGSNTYTFGPKSGVYVDATHDSALSLDAAYGDILGIQVGPTSTGSGPTVSLGFDNYKTRLKTIDSQETTVRGNMDTLANNTYSQYQKGEINSSDLVDPYVLASQQSAGSDFQGWTAAQLTMLGTNSPENFDQIGSFNITTESGTQYEGVLFSQANPASGQFAANNTYNPNQIGGTQYVVTSERIVELKSNFTVDDITTQDGQNVQNVTIQKTQYKTTNTTELKQLYEDLAYKRAQIEAREQALAGGGGFNLGGASSPVVLVALAGAALLLLRD